MKRKNATRRALFTSVLSLLLCVTMFVGTTFAWFTDKVESGMNVITAGNLDVELYHSDKAVKGEQVTTDVKLFDDVKLWEPGAVAYENLQVKNVGNLALKYQMALTFGNATKNAGGRTLADVLKVAVVEGGFEGNREDAKALEYDQTLSTFALEGDLEKNEASKTYGIVIYWEPSSNDNEFNMNNDNQGKIMSIDLGISLFATQMQYEEDSFDETYDKDAELEMPEVKVETPTVDAFLATLAKGETAVLTEDMELAADGNVPADATSGIDLNGKILTMNGNNGIVVEGNLVVDNGTVNMTVPTDPEVGDTATSLALANGGAMDIKSGAVINVPAYTVGVYATGNNTVNVDGTIHVEKDGHGVFAMSAKNNVIDLTDATIDGEGAAVTIYGGSATVIVGKNVTAPIVVGGVAEVNIVYYGETLPTIQNDGTANVVNMTKVASSVEDLNNGLMTLAGLEGKVENTSAVLENCNEPDGIIAVPATFEGTLTIKDSTIKSVQAAGNADIVIEGDVVVNAKGSGVATVAEVVANTSFDGSAITANGTLNISGTGKLTAIAADVKAAFGIGGMNVSKLNISDVHIVKATGAKVTTAIGTNYGKQDFEGAPAIGSGYTGAVINLNSVIIDEALGGSKGAGIGARYHTGLTINITDSTIKNVVGGSSSAGIGGSRMTKHAAGDLQNITITITNSTINATGGDFAAGIGSGYNTYCADVKPAPVISVTIDAASKITAQGGWLGAGIGTGHNALGFEGKIACDISNVKAGSSDDPDWCCWGNPCTTAQNIGLGVLSKNNFPDFCKSTSDAEELFEVLSEGKYVTMTEDMNFSTKDTEGSNSYGAAGVTVTNGSVLDGNGNVLTVTDANGTWDSAIDADAGTIKNLTVNGSFRGIFMGGASGDVYIDNVIIDDVCYTFNSDAGNKAYGVYISNSTLNGWTSYSDVHKEVVFTDCNFGKGTGGYKYAFCRPYNASVFKNCVFEEGFEFDTSKTSDLVFENCYYGDTLITAENAASLASGETVFFYNGLNGITIK